MDMKMPVGEGSPFGGSNGLRNAIVFIVTALVVGGGVYYYLDQREKDVYTDYYQPTSETEVTSDSDSTSSATDYGEPVGSAEYTTADSSTAGYMTFTYTGEGFVIDYPSDWTYSTESSLVLVEFYTDYEDYDDEILENLNVVTEDLAWYGPITVDEYVDINLEQMEAYFDNYVMEERVYTTLAGSEAVLTRSSYEFVGVSLGVVSVVAIIDEKAYIVTYTYDVSAPDKFQAQLDHMIASFTLL